MTALRFPRYSTIFPNALALTVMLTAAESLLIGLTALPAMMAFHVVAATIPGFATLGTNYAGRHEGGWNVNVLVTALCSIIIIGVLLGKHLEALVQEAMDAPEHLLQALIIALAVALVSQAMAFVRRNAAD